MNNNEKVVIHITPPSSAKGLYEQVEKEAARRARSPRGFVTEIYIYAIDNRHLYQSPLEKVANRGDKKGIAAVVTRQQKHELTKWAKNSNTSRGRLLCFIIEKSFEIGLDKIF